MLNVSLLINVFERGRGIWKLNTSLLKDFTYLTLIKSCIMDEKRKYAVPVYNFENFNEIPDTLLNLTIDFDVFLEMILLRVRGETVKYGANKKIKTHEIEKKLILEINSLEQENNMSNFDLLDNKRTELENITEEVMRGHQVRSRVQWLSEGERPTKYFCSLEHRNDIDKTIKKVIKEDGLVLTDQKSILGELTNFYSKLFKCSDHRLDDVELNKLLQGYQVNKLSLEQAESLEGPLTHKEISLSLKEMENNKSPGIDGFPAEFFKVFWKEISTWVLKALNQCFEKRTLSFSLRHCIITCLPKKEKSREFLNSLNMQMIQPNF